MLALRLAYLGLVNLLPEEAYYWNFSQHVDIGYLDHPPMAAWTIWLGTSLFGNTEFGVRIGAYLSWIAAAFFLYRLTANLFGKSTAIICIVLTATLPAFFYTGFIMTPDVPLTVAWAGALYFLERALIADRRQAWWGVGICAGLGTVSKYTIALLGPAALIFLILDPKARRWLRKPEPYVAATLALALFSPVIYWNAIHGWAAFAFQSTQRLEDPATFSTPSLLASAALLLTPLGLISALAVFVSRRRRSVLAPIADVQTRRKLLLITVFTAAPLSVFLAFSFVHQVKLDWTGPVWLAILPAIAAMLFQSGQSSKFEVAINSLWGPTLVGTLAIYAVFLHYLVVGLPLVGHLGNIRTLPVAWDAFGHQVGLVQQAVEKEMGQSVLLAGMDKYFVASEIAFYNRQGPDVIQKSVGAGPWKRQPDVRLLVQACRYARTDDHLVRGEKRGRRTTGPRTLFRSADGYQEPNRQEEWSFYRPVLLPRRLRISGLLYGADLMLDQVTPWRLVFQFKSSEIRANTVKKSE
ncbi:glycosyltransferase family 39 protein [Rhizobium sp. VS19-DR104.2]|nr:MULTISPECIES: glycosyltransferase family 39 protein [unclassified Rhizobium]MBZ5805421.1 glycosyltransferase family 39 protein [Rhizobium sp. VS19-DR181]MBZ5763386.1 glycosyltransferase family 39 protein [Rhizobium sp. VS19-DR96]MBZ5769281.1 glycosyltransferase family 39 protein [Rhizobium sp. VS19-DR129.2]MBZ5776842.1 glycosyltransferase family 39 protein [Rhizobium sp. VS19-DRK62.2]MBZ5787938.1 glycosyltransferase family 39 protein [Rhizobium sp. VS19-DR121]